VQVLSVVAEAALKSQFAMTSNRMALIDRRFDSPGSIVVTIIGMEAFRIPLHVYALVRV
jgi:hypothetical protein